MPSGSDYAKRLLDEAQRSLAPHLSSLQEAVQSLRSHLSVSLEQLAPNLEAVRSLQLPEVDRIISEISAEIHQKKRAETATLAGFARQLRKQETQAEILTLLLDTARSFAPRIALFVTRGDQANGWAARGFADEIVRRFTTCSFPAAESPAFERALAGDMLSGIETSGEPHLQTCLGTDSAGPWHIIPMKTMDHPVALLVAADADGQACDLAALSILTELSVLYLENLAFRILQELGAYTAAAPAAHQGIPAPHAAPMPPLPAAMSGDEEPTLVAPIEEPAEEIPEPRQSPPPAAAIPVEAEPVIALGPPQPVMDAEVEAMVETIGQPGPAQTRSGEAPAASAPTVIIDPAPEPRAAPPLEPSRLSEEEKLHADARRFARLLVSEIKLYNEQKLREGRTNRDIYFRLRRDIDRSREMYERRVSAPVTRKFDYFNDELVRILAENDMAKLGTDYPGPRVDG